MSGGANQSLRRQERLNEILAAYLEAVDAGRAPTREELLECYPDFAGELGEFLDGQERLGRLAGAIAQPAPDALASTIDYPSPEVAETSLESLALHPGPARRERIEVGSVLAGAYRVFDIKAGGMGRVYLSEWLPARTYGMEARAAIKSVADFDEWQASRRGKARSADETQYRNILQRFEREAETWVQLEPHENILQAFYVIDIGAKPYLVMEYADSGDLSSWIAAGRLTVPLAVDFAIQFCRGMSHAVRTAGIVHRDIKPSNVLVKDGRVLKIADFGLSKSFDVLGDLSSPNGQSVDDALLSEAGGGTLPYMAPEQFVSLSRADTRSDIFSFGAMFFEMLTGRKLFHARTAAEHLLLRGQPVPPAHAAHPHVPPWLSALVARCVAYEPGERYQSFDEVLADLPRGDESPSARLPVASEASAVLPETRFVHEVYSLITLGQYEKAVRRSDEALSRFPNVVELWINKSKACADLRDTHGSLEALRRALALDPRHARAWANLAAVRLTDKQPQAALEAARRATRYDPNMAAAWHARGTCEAALGQVEAAIESLTRAVELEPHAWQVQMSLGEALSQGRRYREAISVLRRAAEINPHSSEVWANLAAAQFEADETHDAQQAIDRALTLNPNDGNAWAVRGLMLWRMNHDAAGAEACLVKARQLDPNDAAIQVLARELAEGTAAPAWSRHSVTGDAAPPAGAEPRATQPPGISRCRYWMCTCGAVFEKEDLETKLLLLTANTIILGSRTCAHCRTTYQSADIYAGKHDVPRQYWRQLEIQHGKPAQL